MLNKFLLIALLFLSSSRIIWGQILPLTEEEKKLSYKTHLTFESDSLKKFIIYKGFIVFYNDKYRTPNFTYHKLIPEQIIENGIKAKRRSSFFVDDINLRDKSALNIDYKGSGFDRGHMVPAGDFYSNQSFKDETFVLTNICPQNAVLNRGIWASLENSIRKKVISLDTEAYIITGSILQVNNIFTIGINDVGVPDYFYKIIYIPKVSAMYAFMFDNSVNEFYGTIQDYQVTVNDIEIITQEDFFDLLQDDAEELLESKIIPFE